MEIKNRDVHGRKVSGDEDARKGIDYLDHQIEFAEADVFFKHALTNGSAQFEDQQGRNYTLVRNSNGTYVVNRRDGSSGGWF